MKIDERPVRYDKKNDRYTQRVSITFSVKLSKIDRQLFNHIIKTLSRIQRHYIQAMIHEFNERGKILKPDKFYKNNIRPYSKRGPLQEFFDTPSTAIRNILGYTYHDIIAYKSHTKLLKNGDMNAIYRIVHTWTPGKKYIPFNPLTQYILDFMRHKKTTNLTYFGEIKANYRGEINPIYCMYRGRAAYLQMSDNKVTFCYVGQAVTNEDGIPLLRKKDDTRITVKEYYANKRKLAKERRKEHEAMMDSQHTQEPDYLEKMSSSYGIDVYE